MYNYNMWRIKKLARTNWAVWKVLISQLRMLCYALLELFGIFTTVSNWLCDSQACLSVNHWHSIRDSESKSSTLRSNDATSTRTSLKMWICVFSVFIALVPAHLLCQMQANPPGVEFLLDHIQFQKEKSISSLLVYVVHKGHVTRDDSQWRFSRQHISQRCNVGKMW